MKGGKRKTTEKADGVGFEPTDPSRIASFQDWCNKPDSAIRPEAREFLNRAEVHMVDFKSKMK